MVTRVQIGAWSLIERLDLAPLVCEATEKLEWPYAETEAEVERFRMFLYIVSISGEAAPPPERVDKVWHIFQRMSQYKATCKEIFDGELKHRVPPKQLTLAERAEHRAAYHRTRVLWEVYTGEPYLAEGESHGKCFGIVVPFDRELGASSRRRIPATKAQLIAA